MSPCMECASLVQTICCWLCTRDWLSKKDRCIPFLTRDAQVGFVHGGTAVWGIAVASCSASRKHSVMESPPLDPRRPQCPRKTEMRHGLQSQQLHVASFFLSDETIHGPASPLLLTDELLPRPCLLVLEDLHKSFGRGKGERERGREEGGGRRGRKGGGWSRLVAGLRQPSSESASCRRLMRGSPQKPRS